MEYTTYWSILDTPSFTIKSNAITLVVAISAGLCFLINKKFMKDNGDGTKSLLMWSTAIFAIMGMAITFLLTFIYTDKSDAQMTEMLDSPRFRKVDGVVSNFDRKYRQNRYGREIIESFTVDSIHFAYGDSPVGGFNSFSHTNNDFIFNGQRVRITYGGYSSYGDIYKSIVKIEVGK